MTARDRILNRLKANHPDPALHPRPEIVPLGDLQASPARFAASLTMMGGAILARQDGRTIEESIAAAFPQATLIVSLTPEVAGTVPVERLTSYQQADKVDVMVVRSPFGIAETGSVFLSEKELRSRNAEVHLAQHLVVLLSPHALTANLHTAYLDRPEFRTARYGVLMSGPSATADIQGVLIRGAQGVRSLSVLWA